MKYCKYKHGNNESATENRSVINIRWFLSLGGMIVKNNNIILRLNDYGTMIGSILSIYHLPLFLQRLIFALRWKSFDNNFKQTINHHV